MDFAALPDERGACYRHTPAYADRRHAQSTNAQRAQRVQAVAEHLPNSARDRSAPTPGGGTARAGSVEVRQQKSMSSITTNRPAADVDHSTTAPATAADQLQAEYFLRLLTQSYRRIDREIDSYQRMIATAEAGGTVDYAGGFRRVMRIKEQDRRILEGLIDRLQRRFTLGAPDGVPSLSQTSRLVVR